MQENSLIEKQPVRTINKIMEWILVLTTTLITLIVCYYVFTRYVFKADFFGFEELCILIVVWMYFIGSANASREQSHISAEMLDIFVKNPKTLKLVKVIRRAIGIVIVSVITYLTFDFAIYNINVGKATSLLKIPMIAYHASLVLGFCLMVMYDVLWFINDIKEYKALCNDDPNKGTPEVSK